ncbi:MAG: hypothetical protein A2086_15180 [Spirochaetes bacterium GWD1_27_9]|nr:MAG: hypothetical protein A2Z98_02680 [Spirochaetes bacterium GWB1_27_13]OHD26041.1 MAG: hypothetical protein A2Y34_02400 [Spirochaetes bacterium GWC1_27_15]OHD45106.1 MAG: hypothetical protein A2086_15180 [Spirochaetes bacterium GWD1_27_9]
MRKIILAFVVFALAFSCTNYNKIKTQLEELKKDNPYDLTADNAVKIAIFYNRKYNEKKEHIEEGLKFIEETRKLYPDNNKLLLLHGNLYTIYGGTFARKLDFVTTLKYLDLGCSMIDTAVDKDPDNYDLLLWRGMDSVIMPKQAGRIQVGLEDFANLYAREDLPEDTRVFVLYYYVMGLNKDGQKDEAKKYEKELKEKYPNYKEIIKKLY